MPLLTLTLKVDRQSLKMLETEEHVLTSFQSVLKNLLDTKVGATSRGMEVVENHKYPEYGNLAMDAVENIETEDHYNVLMSSEWAVVGKDWNREENSHQIHRFLSKIKENYRKAQLAIQ